jgi:hypothetical protein
MWGGRGGEKGHLDHFTLLCLLEQMGVFFFVKAQIPNKLLKFQTPLKLVA